MKKHVLFVLSILSILSSTYSPLLASDDESSVEEQHSHKRANTDHEEWQSSKKLNLEELPASEESTRPHAELSSQQALINQGIVQDSALLTLPEVALIEIIDRIDGAKDQYHLARSCHKFRDLVYSRPHAPHRFNNFMYVFCDNQPDQVHLRDRFVRDFFLDTVVGRWEFVETYGDPSQRWDSNDGDLFDPWHNENSSRSGTLHKAGTNKLGTSIFKKCVTAHISRLKKFLLEQPKDTTELVLPWSIVEEPLWSTKYLQLEIGNFRQLETLKVPYSIRAISPAIYMLSHLRVLRLGGNDLTVLPANFGSMPSLEVLDVQANLLRALPKTFYLLKTLREVNLSNNLFEHIPHDLMCMPELEVVDLSNVDMHFGVPSAPIGYGASGPKQRNQVSVIPKEITRIKSLQRLILCGNPVEEVPRELAQISTLRYLGICRSDVAVIPLALSTKRDLQIYTPEVRNARHREEILRKYPDAPEEWIKYDW